MSFSHTVAEQALLASRRSCCICHKFCGTKIELHHIRQKAYGGDDSFENCIPLCFDCHADMGKADPMHPKGKHYSEAELKQHRDNWYNIVSKKFDEEPQKVVDADRTLFNEICSVFSEDVVYYLRDHDFRSMCEIRIFDSLYALRAELDNPFKEFLHIQLANYLDDLKKKMDVFLVHISRKTFPVRGYGERYNAPNLWFYTHENIPRREMSAEEFEMYYREMVADAECINASASELWNSYCDFVKVGRQIIQ